MKLKHSLSSYGFLVVFLSLALSSSEALARKVTLLEISKIALENSNLLKAQLKEIDADVLRTQGTGLLPNPTGALQTGQIQNDGQVGLILETGLFQSLPFPGKRPALKTLADLQKEMAQLQGIELTRLVQHEVTLLAVRLVVLRELSQHTEERTKRFQLIRQYLATHPLISPSQKAEVALVENQVRLLEKTILELEQERRTVDVGLQFFLRSEEPLEPEFPWLNSPSLPPLKDLEEILAVSGIDLQKQEVEVRRAETVLTKTKLDRYPDFNLGVSYRVEALTPSTHFYTGFFTFTVPLWDHGQYSVPAAQARLETEHLRRENLRNLVRRQLKEFYFKAETSAKLLNAFPPTLQHKIEEQFGAAEKEFRKNRITFTQLLQLDAQVHETMDAIFRTQLDYLENLSHLLLFVGRPLEWK